MTDVSLSTPWERREGERRRGEGRVWGFSHTQSLLWVMNQSCHQEKEGNKNNKIMKWGGICSFEQSYITDRLRLIRVSPSVSSTRIALTILINTPGCCATMLGKICAPVVHAWLLLPACLPFAMRTEVFHMVRSLKKKNGWEEERESRDGKFSFDFLQLNCVCVCRKLK